MTSVFVNLSLFKAGWLAIVLLAAANLPLAGTLAALGVVAVHLLRADNRRAELALLGAAGAMGLGWETLMVTSGTLSYPAGTIVTGIAPYWIVAMWLLFATTLNVSMRWLRKSRAGAALTGAIGGPLAFLAGEKAGAVSFGDAPLSLLVIGAGWTLLLPLLVELAVRFEARFEARAGSPAPGAGLARES